MEFNEKLQLLRRAKGISQEKLAEEIGISTTAIDKNIALFNSSDDDFTVL